jgi:hypothetical protein
MRAWRVCYWSLAIFRRSAMTCRFRAKADLRVWLPGRVYEFTPLAIPPAESSRSCTASTDAIPRVDAYRMPFHSPHHLCQWASQHTRLRPEPCFRRLRRCSCTDSRRNAPAPLDFRAPLAPESCARALDFEIGDESLRIANRGLGSTYRLLSFGKSELLLTAALLNDTLTDVNHGGHLILISSINRS